MKRTLIPILLSIISLMAFMGCDETTSHKSGSNIIKITEGTVINGIPSGAWIDDSKTEIANFGSSSSMTVYEYDAIDSAYDSLSMSYSINTSHDTIFVDYDGSSMSVKYWFSSNEDTLYYDLGFEQAAYTPYSGSIPHSSWILKGTTQIDTTDDNNQNTTLIGTWQIDSIVFDGENETTTGTYDRIYIKIESNRMIYYEYGNPGTDTMISSYSKSGNTITIEEETFTYSIQNGKMVWQIPEYSFNIYYSTYNGTLPPTEWGSINSNTDNYEPDNTVSQATSISLNESQSHYLSTSDEDWYSFTASSGTKYRIYTTGNTDTYLTLYESNGSSVIADNDDDDYATSSDDYNASIYWECTSSGTYKFKVEGFDSSETGSYSIKIELTTLTGYNYIRKIEKKKISRFFK